MASYQVKVDLIFGEKGIVRGALNYVVRELLLTRLLTTGGVQGSGRMHLVLADRQYSCQLNKLFKNNYLINFQKQSIAKLLNISTVCERARFELQYSVARSFFASSLLQYAFTLLERD
jgi:hypothetical protein